MERPKVVVFTPVYPPMKGGSATYFSTLVEHLRAASDITVVCLRVPGLPEEEDQDGMRVLRALPDKRSSSRIDRYLSVLPATFKALKRAGGKGDFILHAHSNGIYGLSASVFSWLHGTPMLKEVQDTSDPAFVLKAGRVRLFIAAGGFVGERLRSFGVPKDRVMVFPSVNPPDLPKAAKEARKRARKDAVKIRFIFVGWLVNRIKGTDVLIGAFRKACSEREDLELWIVGEGPDRTMLEGLSKGLPVKFLGELPRDDLLTAMASCDAVILPSHEEANPRCIIEGYEIGLPAIATDVGGVSEEVVDGKTGLLVPDGDADALKEAILKLAGDRGLIEKLGKGGKELLKGLPAWKDISNRISAEHLSIWKGMQKR